MFKNLELLKKLFITQVQLILGKQLGKKREQQRFVYLLKLASLAFWDLNPGKYFLLSVNRYVSQVLRGGEIGEGGRGGEITRGLKIG